MPKKCLTICDERNRAIVLQWVDDVSVRFLTSDGDLELLIGEDVGSYDSIIVFAELEWGNHECSHFYGIEVAVTLRLRLKMLAPMCVLSFMPKAYFAGLEDLKYNVLKARGTQFLQLPFSSTALLCAFDSVIPLSQRHRRPRRAGSRDWCRWRTSRQERYANR